MRDAPRRKPGALDRRFDQIGEAPERPSARVRNDVLYAYDRSGLECARERRVDWDHQLVRRALACLVLGDADSTANDIGPHHPNDITAALSRVEQQSERQSLARAERPSALKLRNFGISPRVVRAESVRLQTDERIVMPDTRLNRIGHDFRQNGARQIGHAGTSGADILDDATRHVLRKLPREPMPVSGEDGL
jgi:hypothetical protein